ncbi:sugar ABC transporter permease [uncultured Sulfitobacter sp.]|uniref:carbohydrate ABC transporter permease n=1 Tax=uncultured Sulfitobacter sp. TaxID=191468 RepID=UPI0026199F16|nr:sugar ABC transporter permease [uncultured Sulfitobacter sp.]
MKVRNNAAWWFIAPAVAILAVVGVVPLVAVFNFSFFDIFTIQSRYWVGAEWYADLLGSRDFYASLGRSLLFSLLVILLQFPLGIFLAKLIPENRLISVALLMLVSLPLVIPWNMIPMIWLNMLHPIFGGLTAVFADLGVSFDYKFNAVHTYILLVMVDTWHWIGLVIVLAYAGLSSIPKPYYQAAEIDGATRWQVFRYIELPKIAGVLMMALLLRTVDSMMIYTEAFAINAGGPNGATTFLSLGLGEEINAFNYGPAAARSIVYFLLVLLIAWGFRTAMTQHKDS